MQYYHDDCAKTSEYTRLGFETAIEVVKDAPTVEAIPKADYEARLKDDLVAMLTELQLEIEGKRKDTLVDGYDSGYNTGIFVSTKIIQDEINALKGENT